MGTSVCFRWSKDQAVATYKSCVSYLRDAHCIRLISSIFGWNVRCQRRHYTSFEQVSSDRPLETAPLRYPQARRVLSASDENFREKRLRRPDILPADEQRDQCATEPQLGVLVRHEAQPAAFASVRRRLYMRVNSRSAPEPCRESRYRSSLAAALPARVI